MNATEQFKLWLHYHRVTAALIFLSLFVALLSGLGSNFELIHVLFISEYQEGLPELFSGELWRAITPIFIHFGFMHIAFNLFWLYQLGSVIEQQQTAKRLLLLVIIIALLSNLAQFFWSGPIFGGMSGVVYGLLAYLWVQGKLNPAAGLYLDHTTAIMMLVWFFVCWAGLVGNIANMAHTIGLVSGLLLGGLYSFKS